MFGLPLVSAGAGGAISGLSTAATLYGGDTVCEEGGTTSVLGSGVSVRGKFSLSAVTFASSGFTSTVVGIGFDGEIVISGPTVERAGAGASVG